MPSYQHCEECATLERAYREAVRVYIEATFELSKAGPEGFDPIYQRAERSRDAYQHARQALNSHRGEHDRELIRDVPDQV